MPSLTSFNRDTFEKLSQESRARKREILRSVVRFDESTKILDIGGQIDPEGQQILETHPHKHNITVVNLETSHLETIKKTYPEINCLEGDATRLPFPDKSFDIVYSNAVIEHVGDYAAQQRMADEVRRVGKRWFITTPNRWFPFEFHVRMPLLSWLPPRLMHRVARLWGYNHHERRYQSGCDYSDTQLLTARQLRRAFPDSIILKPRVTIWPETLVIIGPKSALSAPN
jgi:2-polyprenyl-3-methyl-5-hydroxy-6-metoxy-1,4-benzoquinol methylase